MERREDKKQSGRSTEVGKSERWKAESPAKGRKCNSPAAISLNFFLQVLNSNATEADEAYIFIRDHMLGRLYT